jgi:hypothetical protein
MTLEDNIRNAIIDGRDEVGSWLDMLAGELEKSAERVQELKGYLSDEKWLEHNRTAAVIASDLGALLRQPLGQNAQEFLLRSLANLAEDEGALRVLNVKEEV